MSTKTRNILIGVVGVLLLVGIVFGCIALFGDGVGDQKTQFGEFTNRNVFPQGTSTLSDDGVIRLNAGVDNKVNIVVEAPSEGLYELYLNDYALTSTQYPYVNVTSSAWNGGDTFFSNTEVGDKYDSQGFSERGFVVYLNKGRNVLTIWSATGNTLQINDLKYKLYGFDTDIVIDTVEFTDGYTGSDSNGSIGEMETFLLRAGDKATSTFKVIDGGVYSVGAFALFNPADGEISVKVYDDTGSVVGSFQTKELKDYMVIKHQYVGSHCCTFLDFDDDFELELEVGTYTVEVTTTKWMTYGGAVLDRVGPLVAEE